MIEDVTPEELVFVNLVLIIHRVNQSKIHLMKSVPEEEVFSTLYIPQLDLTVYGVNAGVSAANNRYKKFSFNITRDEDDLYYDIVNDFVNNEWSIVLDTSIE